MWYCVLYCVLNCFAGWGTMYCIVWYCWMTCLLCDTDLQVMVYLGILVTKKHLSWQKILSKHTPLCQNCKYFLWFSSKSYRIYQHFQPKYKNLTKTGNIFSWFIQEAQSVVFCRICFCKFRQDTRKVGIICRLGKLGGLNLVYNLTIQK